MEALAVFNQQRWDVTQEDGSTRQLPAPREFNHKLSTVVNTLAGDRFVIVRLDELEAGDLDAEPGSWDHYLAITVPNLAIWARLAD